LLRIIRPPAIDKLPVLSALCFRSKAAWGYDNDFMEACRRELSIEPCDLRSTSIAVAEQDGRLAGVAQIKVTGCEADLLKLFVEPTVLRDGIGRALFAWAADLATSQGADRLLIEADPDAAPFYRRMGARDVGPSSVLVNTWKNAAKVGQRPAFDIVGGVSLVVLVFGRRQEEGSARSTDRRPKSAKARSRGKLGTGSAAGAMEI
jgi:GNAT superfamily N-acetyltransferase